MGRKTPTKTELFLELARPDENGVSRWVSVKEFTGRYAPLKLGNGLSWGRKHSPLDVKYIVTTDDTLTPGAGIDRIKLDGYNSEARFNQSIRPDIREHFRDAKCVMLGIRGSSVNTRIEIDHKDGRKDDLRVSSPETQDVSDFQPLCKAANDAKRQICKECKRTNKRWNAKNLLGNPFPFYEGDEDYEGTCVGCYQYDPVAYRCVTCKRLIEMTSRDILRQIYADLPSDELEKLLKE